MTEARALPDFEKFTYKCKVCNQDRQEKYIRVTMHDVSTLYGKEGGELFANIKYCADMPMCKEKAIDHEWVLTQFGKE